MIQAHTASATQEFSFAQSGFDFGDAAPVFRASPVGTWRETEYTFHEHTARFRSAVNAVSNLSGFEHGLFQDALNAQIEEHAAQVEWCKYLGSDEEYTLWPSKVRYEASDAEKIFSYCQDNRNNSTASKEFKVKGDGFGGRSAGIHIKGVGSIVVQFFKDAGGHSVRFCVERATHFLDSYRDDFERVYCDQLVWEGAYSAQTIAEAGNKIASVKTFNVGGREYVNKSISWKSGLCECDAYAICAASEWQGDTFTYQALIKAFDDGSMGRGDSRGLLVKVRGVLCVLEKYVQFYDDQPRTAPIHIASTEEDEIEDEPTFNDFDTEDEDELEFA